MSMSMAMLMRGIEITPPPVTTGNIWSAHRGTSPIYPPTLTKIDGTTFTITDNYNLSNYRLTITSNGNYIYSSYLTPTDIYIYRTDKTTGISVSLYTIAYGGTSMNIIGVTVDSSGDIYHLTQGLFGGLLYYYIFKNGTLFLTGTNTETGRGVCYGGGYIYYVLGNTIHRRSVVGGLPEVFSSNPTITFNSGIIYDGSNLWLTGAITSTGQGVVVKINNSGATITYNYTNPISLVLAGDNIMVICQRNIDNYWLNNRLIVLNKNTFTEVYVGPGLGETISYDSHGSSLIYDGTYIYSTYRNETYGSGISIKRIHASTYFCDSIVVGENTGGLCFDGVNPCHWFGE